MSQQVIINHYPIETDQFHEGKGDGGKWEISFDFQVSHEDYHDVTTLLYANDFVVEIPEKGMKFPAVIQSYSTSVTNLYKKGAVGKFMLELVEKA